MYVNDSKGIGQVCLADENTGKIEPNQILIVGGSGIAGKTMFVEYLAWCLHIHGYTVISISDVKDKIEIGFCMFEPLENYHIYRNKKWGVPIRKVKAKIYHPFTFNIPKRKLPEMTIYTIPIKSIGRQSLSYIAETDQDTTSIKILMDSINNLKKNEGLHHLIYNAENLTEVNTPYLGMQLRKTEANSFFTKGSQIGNLKSITQIIGYFKPFQTDYILSPEKCELNINMEKIINDYHHYHILTTKYIRDPKMKSFVIDNFLQMIVETAKDKAKHPIVILMDELRDLVPQKPEGYQIYLANNMRHNLSTMRNIGGSELHGGGISSISATQVYWDVDSRVTNSMTINFFGKTEAVADVEKLAKALRLNTKDMHRLLELQKGEFVTKDLKKYSEPFRPYLPPHRHAEVGYNFEEHYQREYSDKMKSYQEEIKYMEEIKKRIEEEVRQKVLLDNQKIRKHQQAKVEKKEKKIINETKKILKQNRKKTEDDLTQAKIWYEEYKEGQKRIHKVTLGSMATKYNTNKMKIKRAIDKYKKTLHNILDEEKITA